MKGVQYLHENKICHRDLKPENLIINPDTENRNLKIIDFGLSNKLTKSGMLKTSCGSPNYACPEMLIKSSYNGINSDIWACGVILYVMVCGYLPFEDKIKQFYFQKLRNVNMQFHLLYQLNVKN